MMYVSPGGRVQISVKLPKAYIDELDELVKEGRFSSRSEAIRVAIRMLIESERLRKVVEEEMGDEEWP